MQGCDTIRFKFCWLHSQYQQCIKEWPWTDNWWRIVPTPLRLKYTRGNAGVPMDSDARGYPLESKFVPTLIHYTYMKNISSITKFGVMAGVNCGKSAGNCVHFSVDNYDADFYRDSTKLLAEGDLQLPAVVGYPPKPEWDAELVCNYDLVYDTDAELCQEEEFAVTAKAYHNIPWSCIEAAICRQTRILVWVNPKFYDKYLVLPTTPLNLFGSGASSSSTSPQVAYTVDSRQVTAGGPWDASINSLFLNKAISENCALC